jgi:RimJ/RimL family protein N-acetyltransferase
VVFNSAVNNLPCEVIKNLNKDFNNSQFAAYGFYYDVDSGKLYSNVDKNEFGEPITGGGGLYTGSIKTPEGEDAPFVIELRTNSKKNKFLSSIETDIKKQKEWIHAYKKRENTQEEFYFIIESKTYEKLGLVRMYDFISQSFCWGSWLIKDNAPKTTAIESALQIYEFAFYQLNFLESHFDVRKGNEKVIAFHQRFGAKIIDEDELDYFFHFKKKDYEITKKKYKRYL